MNIVKFQHNIAANKERIKNGEFNKRKCKKEIDSIICSFIGKFVIKQDRKNPIPEMKGYGK